MKISKTKLKKMLHNLSAEKRQEALTWIETLSDGQLEKPGHMEKVKFAQELLAKFLNS